MGRSWDWYLVNLMEVKSRSVHASQLVQRSGAIGHRGILFFERDCSKSMERLGISIFSTAIIQSEG